MADEFYTAPGTCVDFVKFLFRGHGIGSCSYPSDGRYASRALRRCLQNHTLGWLIWEQAVGWLPASALDMRDGFLDGTWLTMEKLEAAVLQTIIKNLPYSHMTEKQRMAESSRESAREPVDCKRVAMFVSRIKQWLAKRYKTALSSPGWDLLLHNIAANKYRKRAILEKALARGYIPEITNAMLAEPKEDWGAEKRKYARKRTLARRQKPAQGLSRLDMARREEEIRHQKAWRAWLAKQKSVTV